MPSILTSFCRARLSVSGRLGFLGTMLVESVVAHGSRGGSSEPGGTAGVVSSREQTGVYNGRLR